MAFDVARAKSLFLAASDLTDASERAAYLDHECGAEAELRARVEVLLKADDASPLPAPEATDATADYQPDGATRTFGDAPASAVRSPGVELGAVVAGRYTLVEVIGEGGMGSVYLASQSEPVKRQVALKLIKTGMDSKAVLARFDAERQALAMMDHPNIARIYDGGVTPAGQPYFAMELVKGVPLTNYCDEYRLNVKARLELFVSVCQAVQHAHQKGIIHRDLKPGNVLVTEVDGHPTPKVIDFGVAKATEQKLTEMSFSDVGAIVGTPAYMSPEQADPTSMDIDTRTDVYALGVMLYELLVGSPPIEKSQFQRGALLEMLRMVREVEPPRPSTRLSTADALPNIAANRSIEPAKLSKLLQGELDWVVMKALEKDRTRRYDTANGLARDIQRYLADEVVEARPPSRGYRVKKFVKRNKGQVIAASLVLLALVVGIAGTTVGLIEAKKQKQFADQRAEGERLAKLDAQEKEKLAVVAAEKEHRATELTAARLKQIELINGTMFDIFTEFDIHKVRKSDKPVEYVLAQKLIEAGKKLDAKAIDDPLVLAHLQARLGRTLQNLGQAPAAIDLLEAAVEVQKATLGPDHLDTLTSTNHLALSYDDAGLLDKALPLFEKLLPLYRAKLGLDHLDTLNALNNLGMGYVSAGDFEKALPLLEESFKLHRNKYGNIDPETIISMSNLLTGYKAAGKALDKLLPFYEAVFALMKVKRGTDHPDTLTCMNNLADAYVAVEKLDKALPLKEESLKLHKAKFGPDHPDTLTCMNNLAGIYLTADKLDKALPLMEQTYPLMKAKLGSDHPDTLKVMSNLGAMYRAVGKMEKVLPLLEEALPLMKAKLGADHPDTLKVMSNLAAVFWSAKRLDRSIPLFEESLKRQEAKLGREHPDTLITIANLGVNLKDADRMKEAIPLLEEAQGASKKHASLRFVSVQLLDTYAKAGEAAKFAVLFKEMLPDLRKLPAKDKPYFAGMFALVGRILIVQKKWIEAEPLLRECMAFREKTLPDDWSTFHATSLVGAALLGQKKYADAESLLLKGYEGMKSREKKIPETDKIHLPEVIDCLLELYTATNKPDAITKWQTDRAKYKDLAPMPKEKK